MAKVMIMGVSGFLGSSLAMYLRKKHLVIGSYFNHPVHIENVVTFKLDLLSRSMIGETIKRIRPDVIINTAGMTKVEECEKQPALAETMNSGVLSSILAISEKIGIRLIYCSTDLLYEGRFGNYMEDESVSADNAYVISKISAEHYIKFHSSIYVVLRLALMYGNGNGFNTSFTDWLRNSLSKGESIKLYTDQYRSPLYVRDVARAVDRVIDSQKFGKTYNLGGLEKLNRYEFGQMFAQRFGFDPTLIEPVRFVDQHKVVKRGLDCSLNSSRFYEDFNFKPRHISECFEEMRQELATGVCPDPPLPRHLCYEKSK